jgi:hypothetical protein
MRARVLIAGLTATSIVVIAGPASAKPDIAEASISSPELDGVIRMQAPDTDGLREGGIEIGGGRAHVRADSVEELGVTPADLGPRYLVTYRFQFSDALIRQDLYPYARGGPVTFTAPDQRLSGRVSFSITAGWFRSSLGLFQYLVDNGLPDTNPVAPVATRQPAAGTTKSQTVTWAEVLAVLIGLTTLSLTALAVRRRMLAVGRLNR